MDSIEIRGIDDIGLSLPDGMPDELAEAFFEQVVTKAGALRSHAMALAGPHIAVGGNPWVRLKFIVDIMGLSILPQADKTVAEFAAAGDVQCRAGCSFCCYQNVDVTIPEAILVALQLGNEVDPRRDAVLAAADAFRDLDDGTRIATGKPCPLLVDNRCSVYTARPITCRSLASPDAARCHEALASLEAGDGPLPIEIYVVLRFLCGGEQGAIRGICRDLGLQHDIVELTQTVAAIIREPKLIERWAAGERVFAAR
ncbi:MAG TPA: YkgJ family cysteine cluster protein [Stellaceae bacterium]|nr:YkgJ family cysteine cluster protein [Stellaceae bacterium]